MEIRQKDQIDPTLKKQLQDYVYDVVGVIQSVHNELPQGMPEYLYQEALTIALEQSGIHIEKEFQFSSVI